MDPITAFLASITTSLGASGMALYHGFVSGIAINLLSGKLERAWIKGVQAKAQDRQSCFSRLNTLDRYGKSFPVLP